MCSIVIVRCCLNLRCLVFIVLLIQIVEWSKAEPSTCERLAALAALEDHHTIVETSLRLLAGTWISEGCEIRPGPEYVLRSYTFANDGNFHLIQHHYWDDSCSSPKLTIQSFGRIQLRSSLVQFGASDGLPKYFNISIIPQDHNAAKELDRIVSHECPGQYWRSWRRYENHLIYENRNTVKRTFNLFSLSSPQYQITQHTGLRLSGHIYCLGSLKWAFNELKLLKIQLRPLGEHSTKHQRLMKMELLTGDIHSNEKHREHHQPTSFQVPLIRQTKGEEIVINRRTYTIRNANKIPANIFLNGKSPPHLIEKPELPPYIWGEWVSRRCEIKPLGLYQTRRFSFYSDDSTWIGEHKFYSDPFCTKQKFIVTAAGHFKLDGDNKVLKGTSNMNFEIEKATLTVLDQKTIYDMRLQNFCGEEKWEVDVPQELSSTNGCVPLGIVLPSTLYDIVKIEMDFKGSCLLFLGQTDTMTLLRTSRERPTAFQLPLVKCGDVGAYSQELRDILEVDYYSSSNVPNIYGILVLLCNILVFFR